MEPVNKDKGPHLPTVRMAENWAHGHFSARLGIYQSGRDRMSLSTFTSSLTLHTQISHWISRGFVVQHSISLKNVKVMSNHTSNWSLSIGSHIFCTDLNIKEYH